VQLPALDPHEGGARGGPAPLGGQQDDVFVTVTIQLRNTGPRAVAYAAADFHLQLGTGPHPSQEVASSDSVGSGELRPGTAVEAHLVFVGQRGNHSTELLWQPRTGNDPVEHAWLVDL
jgi:hypothetical protein